MFLNEDSFDFRVILTHAAVILNEAFHLRSMCVLTPCVWEIRYFERAANSEILLWWKCYIKVFHYAKLSGQSSLRVRTIYFLNWLHMIDSFENEIIACNVNIQFTNIYIIYLWLHRHKFTVQTRILCIYKAATDIHKNMLICSSKKLYNFFI